VTRGIDRTGSGAAGSGTRLAPGFSHERPELPCQWANPGGLVVVMLTLPLPGSSGARIHGLQISGVFLSRGAAEVHSLGGVSPRMSPSGPSDSPFPAPIGATGGLGHGATVAPPGLERAFLACLRVLGLTPPGYELSLLRSFRRWGPTKFPNLLKVAGPFRFSATWPRTMLRQPRRGTILARIPRVGTSPHVASPVRPALPAGAKSLRMDGMNPLKRPASRRPIPWPPLPNPSSRPSRT